MNTVIKLESKHEKQFYNFLEKAISARPYLQEDKLWGHVTFILDDRELFGVFEDDQLIMSSAITYTPQMPWVILDTIINTPMDLRKSYKVTAQLFDTMNDYTQKKGIYSYWLLRNARMERTMTGGSRDTGEYRNLTGHGAMLSKIMKDYNISTRAFIKAGNLTGVPLYDYMLKNNPLEYDCIIRELSIKQSTIADKKLERYYTYG